MHGKNTMVVPIVMVVSNMLGRYLKDLGIPDVVGGLQTSAIDDTANILRKKPNI